MFSCTHACAGCGVLACAMPLCLLALAVFPTLTASVASGLVCVRMGVSSCCVALLPYERLQCWKCFTSPRGSGSAWAFPVAVWFFARMSVSPHGQWSRLLHSRVTRGFIPCLPRPPTLGIPGYTGLGQGYLPCFVALLDQLLKQQVPWA